MSQDLQEDQANTGFHQRLALGKRPALILVDIVKAYFEKKSPFYAGVEENLASAIRVLEAARRAKIFIVFTNVVYQKGGMDGGIFLRKMPTLSVFEKGNPLGDWAQGLLPTKNELIISKQYPSAFFGTSLAATLVAKHIDTLIITGLTTSGCVRATCVDTLSHGFIPAVVREAVGDRDQRPHEANLYDMSAKYAEVVSEATSIDYIHQHSES